MRPFGWMGALVVIGAIGAVVLHLLSGNIRGFPDEVMLIFWPAEYVWTELQNAVGRGWIRKIVSNVAFLGLLGGAEGGILGVFVDLYFESRRAMLRRKVKYLPYSKDTIDLAFRRKVQEIMTKYDPGDLINSGSEEDYRPETELILANLKKLGSARELHKFCRRSFQQHFSRDTARAFGEYKSLANDIWGEYQKLLSSPRRQPPISTGM